MQQTTQPAHTVPYDERIADSLSLARWSLGLACAGIALGLLPWLPGWPWPVAAIFGWGLAGLGLVLAFLLLVVARRDRLRQADHLRRTASEANPHGHV
jgi:hypothetical protein